MSDLRNNEEVVGALSLEPVMEEGFLLFATANGEVKRIRVADLPGLSAHAFPGMNVGDDYLGWVLYVNEDDEVLLTTAEAQSIRFKRAEMRPTGFQAGGKRGIKINRDGARGVV